MSVSRIRFDCASAHISSYAAPKSEFMLAYIAGILVILSIAVLIAHALDAFRSRT